jgi:imidazole glycerol phosphate synthase subunit HisF
VPDLMREAQRDEIQKIAMFLTVENGLKRHVQMRRQVSSIGQKVVRQLGSRTRRTSALVAKKSDAYGQSCCVLV